MRGLGSGDRLARGAVKASYLATEKAITEKKWNEMFDDFDPEKFQREGMPKVEGEKNVAKRNRS